MLLNAEPRTAQAVYTDEGSWTSVSLETDKKAGKTSGRSSQRKKRYVAESIFVNKREKDF